MLERKTRNSNIPRELENEIILIARSHHAYIAEELREHKREILVDLEQ